jgi:hypothetical protein
MIGTPIELAEGGLLVSCTNRYPGHTHVIKHWALHKFLGDNPGSGTDPPMGKMRYRQASPYGPPAGYSRCAVVSNEGQVS